LLNVRLILVAMVWVLLPFVAIGASPPLPTDLRCEYLRNPLGIDTPQPRLSWVLQPGRRTDRAQSQTAYQILAATSWKKLQLGQGDLWDSGKTLSDCSIHVPYAGQPLMSGQECFWKLRIWDQEGKVSGWSEPSRWTMGLLNRYDWHGQWIGLDDATPDKDAQNVFADAQWIWFPEGQPERSAPVGTRYFRRLITLSADRVVKQAFLFFTADDSGEFFINGQKAGSASDFHSACRIDITRLLHAGGNVCAASAHNAGSEPNPAGLIALIRVEFTQGEPLVVVTDPSWKAANQERANWQSAELDEASWKAAQKLGPAGMAPWGAIKPPEDRRLPARLLRREFVLQKKVGRATAYVSGLGLFEFYLNGRKVGDHVLEPGLTDYSKRIFYVTFDVTKDLKKGANAVGLMLGNGRFYAPRSDVPTGTTSYGFPKLLFELRVDYTDETADAIVSDSAWNLTTNGPIRANNEYDGEEYDARMEIKGWSRPGFDDAKWQRAQIVTPPGGVLAAQMMEPIRVTKTLRPVAMSEPHAGVYIFDFGQNMVGWCRLRVAGQAGAAISLRHAERLKPDGTLYLDNLRSAKATDTYILRGKGTEVYEPRFTYHGFRYVELTGYPGKPRLSCLDGRVVHDDLENAGDFACSNPLLNQIYWNIRWGVRGNYRSIPTDCPQRDERQGWLGDRSAESKGETYLFNTALLYGKWLQDMADAQKDSGSVSDVCPAYWPFYSDNVTWPSSSVIIPAALRDQFADETVIARHYASAKLWVDYMSGFLKDGIIARDSYGDWCVPPEEQKLIHSNDPKRQTDGALLATAYFYYDICLMEEYANLLGNLADAQRFAGQAAKIKTAFNARFLKPEAGQYDNGSQTSCVLPLAFGLVPPEQRQRIFDLLVNKITKECNDHIGTGLIGGQWLMRVLSDNGRADLAYKIATQQTYPSWGYMVSKGATTIWELWNGDTADPAMNSGNHVMLVGDLGIWLFEYLAGIKPDPAQPGFKHIIMRPEAVGDLRFVKASHRSAYGLIASDWKYEGDCFQWQITVPVNTTATVWVPARKIGSVTVNGKPARHSQGVKFLKTEEDRAVFLLGSGNYRFESR
jgi:alpha-L-rhamnosidase